MKQYNINDSFVLEGKWFFPNNKSASFFGQLIYDLKLNNPLLKFWSEDNIKIKNFRNNTIYWGYLEEGTPITLIDVNFKSSISPLANGLSLSKGFYSYSCDVFGSIIIGKHYKTVEEIQCKEIISNFSALENLSINNNLSFRDEEESLQIDYNFSKGIKTCSYLDYSYEIVCEIINNIGVKNISCYKIFHIKISSNTNFSYENIEKNLNILNHFLIFKTNKRSEILYINCFDKDHNQFYILNYWNKKRESPELNQRMVLNILLPTEEYPLDSQLKKWLILYAVQETALNNFYYFLSTKKYFIQEKFLACIQIFEDFHRHSTCFRQNQIQPSSSKPKDLKYFKKKQEILHSCPEEHKIWLTDKLEIMNEIPLTPRLLEIITKFTIIFNIYLGIPKSVQSSLVQKIVATRNYLTHRSNQSKKNAIFQLSDIMLVTQLVEVMINCMILMEMEYPIDLINEEIYNKRCFYDLIPSKPNQKIEWDKIK